MANVELTDLTPAGDLSLADGLYIVQGGNSRYATFDDVKRMLGEGYAYIGDGQYETESNARTIAASSRTLLTNDATSTTTLTTYGGQNRTTVADWWDTATNAHVSEFIGESYTWRVDFRVKKTGAASSAFLTLEQDIGGAVGVITERTVSLRKAAGEEQAFSASWGGYALDTYQANGAKFYVTSDTEIELWDFGIMIRRDWVPVAAS